MGNYPFSPKESSLGRSGTWRSDVEKERKEGNKGKEWVRVWTGKKEGKKKTKKRRKCGK